MIIMSFKRVFIMTAVLILCISGIRTQAAETKASAQASQIGTTVQKPQTEAAAQVSATGTKKTVKTNKGTYTSQELCSMAKYYYKKTSKDGYYPPIAECTEEADGTYTIGLRERVDDGNGDYHFATYAWYNVNADGKGQDTMAGSSVDFTRYCKVYTPEELCKLAQDYYYRMYDFYPPNASYTANTDGTYTICLFEIIKEDGNIEHSATFGWYTVDVCGMGQDDIMSQAVDINP